MGLIAPIISDAEAAVASAMSGAAGAVATGVLGRIFVLFLSITILTWATKLFLGREPANPVSIGIKLIRYSLIAMAGASVYKPTLGFEISKFIVDLPLAIGAAVGVSMNNVEKIDAILQTGIDTITLILKADGGGFPEGILLALVAVAMAVTIFFVTVLTVLVAVLGHLSARWGLGIAVIFAPLGIYCLAWDKLQGYFEAWLKFAITMAIVFVINAIGLNAVLSLLQKAQTSLVSLVDGEGKMPISLSGLAVYCVTFSIAAFLMTKAEQYAFALGGSSGGTAAGFMSTSIATTRFISNKATGAASTAWKVGAGAFNGAQGKSFAEQRGVGQSAGWAAGRAARAVYQSMRSRTGGASMTGSGGNTVRRSSSRLKPN